MGIYDRLSLVNKILDDINLSVERKGISGTGRDFIQLAVKEYLESLTEEMLVSEAGDLKIDISDCVKEE
jgi:hypothetical protein